MRFNSYAPQRFKQLFLVNINQHRLSMQSSKRCWCYINAFILLNGTSPFYAILIELEWIAFWETARRVLPHGLLLVLRECVKLLNRFLCHQYANIYASHNLCLCFSICLSLGHPILCLSEHKCLVLYSAGDTASAIKCRKVH